MAGISIYRNWVQGWMECHVYQIVGQVYANTFLFLRIETLMQITWVKYFYPNYLSI